MSLTKNTATNAAELYKLLSKANAIQCQGFWPNPSFNKNELLLNPATNAAELYKLLSKANAIQCQGFWPNPSFNKNELLLNPASKTMTVYERDGSDYTISIESIKNIVTYEIN